MPINQVKHNVHHLIQITRDGQNRKTLTMKRSRICSRWNIRSPKTSSLVRPMLCKFLQEAKLVQALLLIQLRLWLFAALLLLILSALIPVSLLVQTLYLLGKKQLLNVLQLFRTKFCRKSKLRIKVFNGLLNNHLLLITSGQRRTLLFVKNMNSPLLLRIRNAGHQFQTCINWEQPVNLIDLQWKSAHLMLLMGSLLSHGLNQTLIHVLQLLTISWESATVSVPSPK